MKWEQVDKYHIKSNGGHLKYYISKSIVYEKVLYELWNGNKWLYKSENIEDVKREAIQHNKEQSTSIGAEAK